jgi:Tol biopolymer transport system component
LQKESVDSKLETIIPTPTKTSPSPFAVLSRTSKSQEPKATSTALPTSGGNGGSFYPSISADGRFVAFSSAASNLVAGDNNNQPDIFVVDRTMGETQLVSLASNGTLGNATSTTPSISGDGQTVVFASMATNLVAADTNGESDIFLHDRQTGTTDLVSVGINQRPANNRSWSPSLSQDGRRIVFVSWASNLVKDDTNNQPDIFVYDRLTRETFLVSVGSNGALGNGWSDAPDISADGQLVVFSSEATNLVPNDTNNQADIFVHNQQTGETQLVSKLRDDIPVSGGSPVISGDGTTIAFVSWATDSAEQQTELDLRVFVHDRKKNETRQVAEITNEIHGSIVGPGFLSISNNGGSIAFWSAAAPPNSENSIGTQNIFVHDQQTGMIDLVSIASNGATGNGVSATPSLSSDGRWIAFRSSASNLVANDVNDQPDIFVYDRLAGTTELVSKGRLN